jgi:hypothetical protein
MQIIDFTDYERRAKPFYLVIVNVMKSYRCPNGKSSVDRQEIYPCSNKEEITDIVKRNPCNEIYILTVSDFAQPTVEVKF